MPSFEKVLDGRGIPPRQCQIDYFNHLSNNWDKFDIHAAQMPPGTGKSYIARTIQRTIDKTSIITPANLLVDQYCHDYPELVAVKGQDYYNDLTEYYQARKQAVNRPAVFNPLSFYYYHLRAKNGVQFPSVVIIDEAHLLSDMLLLIVSRALPIAYYGIPDKLSDIQFYEWLNRIVMKLELVDLEKHTKFATQYETLKILQEYLKKNLHTVKITYEHVTKPGQKVSQYCLVIQPVTLPIGLLETIFRDAKLILMSGSLTKFDLEQMFPTQHVDYITFEPLAPVENRPIYYKPIPIALRRDPNAIAKSILAVYEAAGRPNTLIHVSYSLAEQLKPLLPKSIITHDSDSKSKALERFKLEGGIFLASGMAEGIDLPGDLCRLIIIPVLLFPNKGDQAVAKKLALPKGEDWYQITTIATTIQQIGRGVRSAEDRCNTVILDYYLKSLVKQTEKYLTEGFKASIKWS